eukprot:scaffold71842_cov33-Tisochrysis_lutea.AAC.2
MGKGRVHESAGEKVVVDGADVWQGRARMSKGSTTRARVGSVGRCRDLCVENMRQGMRAQAGRGEARPRLREN